MAVLTKLIPLIHEHGVSFIYLCLFQLFLIMLCSFKYISPSHPLLSLFLSILLFLLQLQKEFDTDGDDVSNDHRERKRPFQVIYCIGDLSDNRPGSCCSVKVPATVRREETQ